MNKDLETGKIIAETFKLLFSNFATYFTIGVLVLLPVIALTLYTYMSPPSVGVAAVLSLVTGMLQAVLGQFATAAIVYGVFRRLNGDSASLQECLAAALRRLVPVIVVGFLAGLAIALGTLLLIVPGLILMTVLFVVIPVTVVERAGVGQAFSRSALLTQGQRMRIFFVALFLSILGFVLGYAAGLASVDLGLAGQVLTLVVVVFSTILQATAASLVYYRLRESKENIGVEQIAETFA